MASTTPVMGTVGRPRRCRWARRLDPDNDVARVARPASPCRAGITTTASAASPASAPASDAASDRPAAGWPRRSRQVGHPQPSYFQGTRACTRYASRWPAWIGSQPAQPVTTANWVTLSASSSTGPGSRAVGGRQHQLARTQRGRVADRPTGHQRQHPPPARPPPGEPRPARPAAPACSGRTAARAPDRRIRTRTTSPGDPAPGCPPLPSAPSPASAGGWARPGCPHPPGGSARRCRYTHQRPSAVNISRRTVARRAGRDLERQGVGRPQHLRREASARPDPPPTPAPPAAARGCRRRAGWPADRRWTAPRPRPGPAAGAGVTRAGARRDRAGWGPAAAAARESPAAPSRSSSAASGSTRPPRRPAPPPATPRWPRRRPPAVVRPPAGIRAAAPGASRSRTSHSCVASSRPAAMAAWSGTTTTISGAPPPARRPAKFST